MDRDLLIACLCAEWCTACRAYRTVFDEVAAMHPELRFSWVDIEDSASLFDRVEVETFPTILIGEGSLPRFYGAIAPHRDVLVRLIASHRSADERGQGIGEEIAELLGQLQSTSSSSR